VWKVHAAARLKQEAPEEENAQDDGKRDDDYLDESHSRFLTVSSACALFEKAFYRRARRCVNVCFPKVRAALDAVFIKAIRRKRGVGFVLMSVRFVRFRG
jgi:hypothetical protein